MPERKTPEQPPDVFRPDESFVRPRPISGATLGARILAALERDRMSKADLARAVKTRWATVHIWCTDQNQPSADNLRRIAEAIPTVTLEELLGVETGQRPPFEAWADFIETPEGRSLTEEERLCLQSWRWPAGREPTVTTYQMALLVIRSTSERRRPK